MALATWDRFHLVAALQLSKKQLDSPAGGIQLTDVLGPDRAHRQVGDVPVIDPVHLIPQADDPDTHCRSPSAASILAPLKEDLSLGIEHGASQARTDLPQTQSFHCQRSPPMLTVKAA